MNDGTDDLPTAEVLSQILSSDNLDVNVSKVMFWHFLLLRLYVRIISLPVQYCLYTSQFFKHLFKFSMSCLGLLLPGQCCIFSSPEDVAHMVSYSVCHEHYAIRWAIVFTLSMVINHVSFTIVSNVISCETIGPFSVKFLGMILGWSFAKTWMMPIGPKLALLGVNLSCMDFIGVTFKNHFGQKHIA